jgi:serine/threonine protein kinase
MPDIKQYEPLWGSWYVDELIGEGSFGKVNKCRKEEFSRTYYSAVKIISIPQNDADLRQIRGEGMDEESARSYFQAFVSDIIQEIDLMSAFRGNSNVVSFEDHKVIERTDKLGWDILIRMELLTSLTDHANDKPLSQNDVVKLGIHICRALELCALKKTIHRDIKPDNIFVSEYGEYKLGDFGIARQVERTMSGLSKKGTYTYMAPEVFKGDDYGASVDTYSLGIVLYRYLNGGRTPLLPNFPTPITPRDRDDAMQRRMRGEALPPISSVNPSLNAIVLKACAFERNVRYAGAAEMRLALETVLSGAADKTAPNSYSPAVAEPLTEAPEGTERTEGVYSKPPKAAPTEQTETTAGVFSSRPAPEHIDPTSTTVGAFDAHKKTTSADNLRVGNNAILEEASSIHHEKPSFALNIANVACCLSYLLNGVFGLLLSSAFDRRAQTMGNSQPQITIWAFAMCLSLTFSVIFTISALKTRKKLISSIIAIATTVPLIVWLLNLGFNSREIILFGRFNFFGTVIPLTGISFHNFHHTVSWVLSALYGTGIIIATYLKCRKTKLSRILTICAFFVNIIVGMTLLRGSLYSFYSYGFHIIGDICCAVAYLVHKEATD